MADEQTPPVPSNDGNQPGNTPKPDGDQKSQDGIPVNQERVPLSRLNEEVEKRKASEAKLAEYEKAEKERQDKEALARGEHEKVINDLTPKAAKAESYSEFITKLVEKELETFPEEDRVSIKEDLSGLEPTAQYNLIAKLKARMVVAKPSNVGRSSTPPANGEEVNDQTTFTTSQIKDIDFFTKNKEAIIKAQKEGRIVEG